MTKSTDKLPNDTAAFHDYMERSFDYLIRTVNEKLKDPDEIKSSARADWLLENAAKTLEQAGRVIIEKAAAERIKQLED